MLRLIPLLPVFVILVYAVAMVSRLEAYHSSHALLLGFIYLYNFLRLRRQGGLGFRMFRFSLVVLSAAFFEHAFIFLWMYNRGNAPDWARYLHHETYYDFALHCVMAFSAMAMWSETQMDRLRGLLAEVESRSEGSDVCSSDLPLPPSRNLLRFRAPLRDGLFGHGDVERDANGPAAGPARRSRNPAAREQQPDRK